MVTYYVDPDSAAGGDGTSWANAYDTLSAAEAAKNTADGQGGGTGSYTDIVRYLCRASSGTADTTTCVIDGGSQTSAYYLLIQTDTGHRATAKWDASKYRLSVTNPSSGSGALVISDLYVRVDGLQAQLAGVNADYVAGLYMTNFGGGTGRIDIANCLVVGTGSTTGYIQYGIATSFSGTTLTLYVTNTVVHSVPLEGNCNALIVNNASLTAYVYNCTLHGGNYTFGNQLSALYAKNVYAGGGLNGDYLHDLGNPGTFDKVNCASSDTTADDTDAYTTATNCIISVPLTTATFVDPTNATILSRDWHIVDTGSDIYGAGVAPGGSDPLNYTTDIEGDTIGVSGRYDIGADYFYTAEAAGPTVFKTMLRRWR